MENKRRKKIYVAICIFIIILLAISSVFVVKKTLTGKDKSSLINIASLSDEFIDNYFEGIEELNNNHSQDNILIVSSLKPIKNNYGAIKIVEAPNNQYILQYKTEEDKNNAFEKFKNSRSIFSVEENVIYTLDETTYDSWAVEKNAFDNALAATEGKDLNEVVVAIIDSGCNIEVFNEKYSGRLASTHNVIDGSADVTDKYTHGTFIAGIIAESTPSNVKIMPIKMMHAENGVVTGATAVELQAAIYYAIEKNVDIINLSIGGGYSEGVELAITSAIDANITVVAAVGNDNWDKIQYPAAYDNVITVAAVDSRFERTIFSNYGDWITFSAPGYKVGSLTYAGRPKYKNGTSYSTPYVVAAAAILKSYNKNLTVDNVIELLKKHAIDIGDDGYDEYYGYGVISFEDAEFCSEEVVCDEYGVFKETDIYSFNTINIVSNGDFSPEYNYGSITNIMNAEINLYYTDDDYYTKTLGQLIDDIEITGYEPYSFTEQAVKIKYKDLETTLNIDNRNMKDGWKYEELADGTLKLTGINFSTTDLDLTYAYSTYPSIINIPKIIDDKTITVLGENLFTDMITLRRVIIPYGVKRVESGAFSRTSPPPDELEHSFLEVVFPNSIEYIAEDTFKNRRDYEVALRVFKESVSHFYATNHDYKYSYPESIKINIEKRTYEAFEKVPDNFTIDITYGGTEQSSETIESGFTIKYNNDNDSFRYNDTSFIVVFNTKLGHYIEGRVPVTILKATPQYIIPNDLTALIGQKLSEINLPDGFVWTNPDEVIKTGGNASFEAKYTPLDTENYKIVENIKVPINVLKEIIIPEITISDKIYDGTTAISIDDITVSNLEKSEYSIESVVSSSSDVGDRIATIKIKLTDEKYKSYAFSDQKQEGEFNIEFEIVPLKVEKPTLKETSYTYNGLEQSVELNNYLEDKMNISGNKRTNAGEQDVSISLKNNNYIWNDNSSDVVILKFKIEKATPEYTIPTNLTANVGQKLSEINLPENFEWMNADEVIDQTGNLKFKAKYIPSDDENYKIIENIDITITVNKKEYTVVFEANGGIFTGNKTTIVIDEWEDSKLVSLEKPTRQGYTFKGYYTEKTGGTSIESYIAEAGIDQEGLKFYAQWEEAYSYIINEYSVDETTKIIKGIPINTNDEQFRSNVILNAGYTLEIVRPKEHIGTNTLIKIYKDEILHVEFTAIVKGDITGDGLITLADLSKFYNYYQKNITMDKYFELAADVNEDSKFSLADLSKFYNYYQGNINKL